MKELSEDEARALIAGYNQHTEPKYPWDQWMNGSWWLIKQGEDFDSQIESLRTGLLNRARRHGVPVKVHKRGDTLLFKFSKTEK